MKPHEVYDITTHNLWNSLQITKTESESYTKVLIEKYSGLARLVVSRASSTSKWINLWTYLYPYLQRVAHVYSEHQRHRIKCLGRVMLGRNPILA